MMVNSLPDNRFAAVLNAVLEKEIVQILGLHSKRDTEVAPLKPRTEGDLEMIDVAGATMTAESDRIAAVSKNSTNYGHGSAGDHVDNEQPASVHASRMGLMKMFMALDNLGLGGERSQRVFAEVMNRLMTEYVAEAFSDEWAAPSTAPVQLRYWVENKFARLVVEVLNCVRRKEDFVERSQELRTSDGQVELVSLDDLAKWQDMAIARLGRLRVKQLFDIVVDWDSSEGAVQDLKASGFQVSLCHETDQFARHT